MEHNYRAAKASRLASDRVTNASQVAGGGRAIALIKRIEQLLPLAIDLKFLEPTDTCDGSLLDEMMERVYGRKRDFGDKPGALIPAEFLTHLLSALRYAFGAMFLFRSSKRENGWPFLGRQIGLPPELIDARDAAALLSMAEAATSFAEGYLAAASDRRAVLSKAGEAASAAKRQRKAQKVLRLAAETAHAGGEIDAELRKSIGEKPGIGWSPETVRKELAALRQGAAPATEDSN